MTKNRLYVYIYINYKQQAPISEHQISSLCSFPTIFFSWSFLHSTKYAKRARMVEQRHRRNVNVNRKALTSLNETTSVTFERCFRKHHNEVLSLAELSAPNSNWKEKNGNEIILNRFSGFLFLFQLRCDLNIYEM